MEGSAGVGVDEVAVDSIEAEEAVVATTVVHVVDLRTVVAMRIEEASVPEVDKVVLRLLFRHRNPSHRPECLELKVDRSDYDHES
jgi:hypothetical protein